MLKGEERATTFETMWKRSEARAQAAETQLSREIEGRTADAAALEEKAAKIRDWVALKVGEGERVAAIDSRALKEALAEAESARAGTPFQTKWKNPNIQIQNTKRQRRVHFVRLTMRSRQSSPRQSAKLLVFKAVRP